MVSFYLPPPFCFFTSVYPIYFHSLFTFLILLVNRTSEKKKEKLEGACRLAIRELISKP